MKFIQIVFLVILTILLSIQSINSGKILGFYGTPSPSHMIIHTALIYELANRGHDVRTFLFIQFFKTKTVTYLMYILGDNYINNKSSR